MQSIDTNQFTDFFHAVHGYTPFDWQKRLAREVFENGFHDVIRVPTGCGKTSVLDIAVFQLAQHVEWQPQDRTAARRICFVIDRRLVVDEVTAHALQIRNAILAAAQGRRDEPVLRSVAQRLVMLAAKADEPLRVVRLRGGVYRDDGWAADPLTPTILVSTVDQVGSRLLFRGYGVNPRSRPLHAGLLAFDTCIILDEAHLSTVFTSTINRVRRYQQLAEGAPMDNKRRLGVVCMSATVGEAARMFEFGAKPKEWQDKLLMPRLEASKPAELIEVKMEPLTKQKKEKQAQKAQEQRNRTKLVQDMVACAKRVAGIGTLDDQSQDTPRVIGVVVNRVATAREIFEALHQAPKDEPERDVVLLTGRIRPYDRDRLLLKWLPFMKAGRKSAPGRLLFVVATQTVEVGANLDFDALVTEAAPLDALRQRFGRLDRLGKRHERNAPSPACILIRSDMKLKSDDDPVYGSAIAKTWEWLEKSAETIGKGTSKKKIIDFGTKYLDLKLPKDTDEMRPMLAPQREAPILFPAHLDAWVQTNPVPEPDPDVAPFLHGQIDVSADALVVWRADLKQDNELVWAKIGSLFPPRTREALPVPVYEVRAWLNKQAEANIADVEGAGFDTTVDQREQSRSVLRWRGPNDSQVIDSSGVRPGDTLIVPADYGGADQYGWNPKSAGSVEDVGDACLSEVIASYPTDVFRRPTLRLRLHPDLLSIPDQAMYAGLLNLLEKTVSMARIDEQDSWPFIRNLLDRLKVHILVPAHRAAIEAVLKAKSPLRVDVYPDGSGVVLCGAVPVQVENGQGAVEVETEFEAPNEDEDAFVSGGRSVLLDKHCRSVGKTASEFAQKCGLSHDIVEQLFMAGQWHDEGKRDRRFQAWLHGSELKALAALFEDQPLAKSGLDPKQWKRSEAFSYPRGSRHEFVSVALFNQAVPESEQKGDLIRFLIGTHHGCGRAFPPVLDDPSPVEVGLEYNGKRISTMSDHRLYCINNGWIDLFWRMVRKYGWWGIAYLETLLVSADRSVSAREQRETNPQLSVVEVSA